MKAATYRRIVLWSIAVWGIFCLPGAIAGNKFITKNLGKGWILATPVADGAEEVTEKIQRTWTITAEKILHPSSKEIVASGKVVVVVQGQDALLKADEVNYDQKTGILHAYGHVQILRRGVVTKASVTGFKVDSPEYIVTDSKTVLCDPILKTYN